MSTELDRAVAHLQFHISFYNRVDGELPAFAKASQTVLEALAAAGAKLDAVQRELDHLEDLIANVVKRPDDASDDYWAGANDAQEYLTARIRSVLKEN